MALKALVTAVVSVPESTEPGKLNVDTAAGALPVKLIVLANCEIAGKVGKLLKLP